jgi:hypothetical protein
MSLDRSLKPRFDASNGFEICLAEAEPLDVLNTRRQQVGIDDPDRSPESFNIRILVSASLARPIRARDDQKNRRLSVW